MEKKLALERAEGVTSCGITGYRGKVKNSTCAVTLDKEKVPSSWWDPENIHVYERIR